MGKRSVAVKLKAAVVVVALATPHVALGQQATQAPGVPGGRGTTPPGAPGAPSAPGTTASTLAAPPVPTAPRTFTGKTGLVFNTVRPDRVNDFETLLAEVQQALAKSPNPATQAQAKAWRFLRATEPGPNGTVMYVFLIDPVAPGEDYSLGKVLVEAFPDATKLQEIWRLYTGSVTGGGSLVNLNPVSAERPAGRGRGAGPAATPPGATPSAPAPTPGPAAP